MSRKNIKAFTIPQRLLVMLLKTAVGYDLGSVNGASDPSYCLAPGLGKSIDSVGGDFKVYRMLEDTIIVADAASRVHRKDLWSSFLQNIQGILLQRIGKIRVVYILRVKVVKSNGDALHWHSNINLVTGVSKTWLDGEFSPGIMSESSLVP